jgi:hypothetical protein
MKENVDAARRAEQTDDAAVMRGANERTHFPSHTCLLSRHVASNALLALAGFDHSVLRSSTRRAYIFATIAGFAAATLLCSVQSPPTPLPTL